MTHSPLDWYKHEPRAFLRGVQGLGADMIGAYIVLLDLIYERGGDTRRDDHHLAGILGVSKRLATVLTNRLIEHGKIVEEGEFLSNPRAKVEVIQAKKLSETRANARRKVREKAYVPSKNNDLQKQVSIKRANASQSNVNSSMNSRATHTPARAEDNLQLPLDINTDSDSLTVQSKKPHRIPDDFHPDLSFAAKTGLTAKRAMAEAENFIDYWRSKPKDNTKLDWPATWRTWCRRAVERLPTPSYGSNSGHDPGREETVADVARKYQTGEYK